MRNGRTARTRTMWGAALILTAAIAATPARAQGVWGGAPYGGVTYQFNAPYYGGAAPGYYGGVAPYAGGQFYSNQGYYNQGYYGQGYSNQGYYNPGFNGVNFYYGSGWSSTPPVFNGYSTPQPTPGLNSFGVPRLNAGVPVLRP